VNRRMWTVLCTRPIGAGAQYGRILAQLLGPHPDERRLCGTALEYIAATGCEIRGGEPA
jgi:hypothetical protein